MDNISNSSKICNFNTSECKGRMRLVTNNIEIPKSNESIFDNSAICRSCRSHADHNFEASDEVTDLQAKLKNFIIYSLTI